MPGFKDNDKPRKINWWATAITVFFTVLLTSFFVVACSQFFFTERIRIEAVQQRTIQMNQVDTLITMNKSHYEELLNSAREQNAFLRSTFALTFDFIVAVAALGVFFAWRLQRRYDGFADTINGGEELLGKLNNALQVADSVINRMAIPTPDSDSGLQPPEMNNPEDNPQ